MNLEGFPILTAVTFFPLAGAILLLVYVIPQFTPIFEELGGDLPTITKAAGRPVTTALLKGRANYLCLHRLEQVTEPAAEIADEALSGS